MESSTGGGEGDRVRSSKTSASLGQGALPNHGAALVRGRYINRLLFRGHWLVPVEDVLRVGIPYRPVGW